MKDAWRELEDLLEQDSSARSVEFGHLGTAYDCRIRRDRAVHVIVGSGPMPSAALHDAIRRYQENT